MVKDEKKAGTLSRFGSEGNDNDGRALDSRLKASVPPDAERRCRAPARAAPSAGLELGAAEGETTMSLGPVFQGVGNGSGEGG